MFVLADTPSVANQFLVEMRDTSIQKDRLRFRRNLERLAEILAYEISKTLPYKSISTETPLGTSTADVPSEQPVLFAVLRASIPFYQGFLNYFDVAGSGFIGAYRVENDSTDIAINLGYHASPSIEGKIVIITDPMLATGKSIIQSLDTILVHGNPSHIHIAAAVAAPEGIEFIEKNLSHPYSLWLGAIDQKLDHRFYIVPGLGDAGDLAFGPKL